MLTNVPLIWISEASASFTLLIHSVLFHTKAPDTILHLALMDCIENEIGVLQSYYYTVIVFFLSSE